MYRTQRSTSFRTQLLNKGKPAGANGGVGPREGGGWMYGNSGRAFQEAQSKIPSLPRALESDREFMKSGSNNGEPFDLKSKIKMDVSHKIEKALRAIEEKLDVPDNNIVEESV